MPICGGVEWYCFVRIGLGNCLAEHFHCNKLIACDGEGVLEEIKKSPIQVGYRDLLGNLWLGRRKRLSGKNQVNRWGG